MLMRSGASDISCCAWLGVPVLNCSGTEGINAFLIVELNNVVWSSMKSEWIRAAVDDTV